MSDQDVTQDFEQSFLAMLETHRRHAAVLADAARVPEAPRSRRALYNAIKAYRKAETALYHAVTGEAPSTEDKN